MSAWSMRELVENCSHTVTCRIDNCEMDPIEDFLDIKRKIPHCSTSHGVWDMSSDIGINHIFSNSFVRSNGIDYKYNRNCCFVFWINVSLKFSLKYRTLTIIRIIINLGKRNFHVGFFNCEYPIFFFYNISDRTTGSSSGSTSVSSPASSTGHSQSSGSSSTSENETTTSASSTANSPSSTLSDYSTTSVTGTSENAASSSGSTAVSSSASSTGHSQSSGSSSTSENETTTSAYSSVSSPSSTTSDYSKTSVTVTTENTTPSSGSTSVSSLASSTEDTSVSASESTTISTYNSPSSSDSPLLTTTEAEQTTLSTNETDENTTSTTISPTTSHSTTTPSYVVEYPVDSLVLVVDLEVTLGDELPFNESLQNRSTSYFRQLARDFESEMNRLFANETNAIDGFKEVSVTGFRNGSIIVDFEMKFYGGTNLASVGNETLKRLNETELVCPETDDHIYSGDLCQDKTDKLALSLPYIIGITAGVGGALLLFAIVLLVILCCMRSNQEGKGHLSDFGPGPDYNDVPTEARRSLSEGPSSSSAFFHGREHRVVTDSIGNPTYLYQPDGKRKHSIEDSHVNYGYQDNESDVLSGAYTEIKPGSSLSNLNLPEKFEIERPKLKPAANNPYYF
ncbi:hypothetical protein MAR_035337 [Mya arenaria]|uniref:SEA domain-containing protein n=1 Tax=Mya arenaria TaxID=6604 RepID=A0ABY7EN68_MYAAR|nr:hypothetical protein MAR_035337 [Mya arenaria]